MIPGLQRFFRSNFRYKAISTLDASEYISSKYKIPIKLFFALSAIGMVWKGNDFLASEGQDFNKMLRSASVSAKLFESDQQEVTKVEQSFAKSTFSGLSEIVKNFKSLLLNKFLLNLFIKQGINIVKLIVLEKFLSGLVSNLTFHLLCVIGQEYWPKKIESGQLF